MAKAVLISIRPEWAEKILFGKKTLEVRKTRPCLEMPFKCYIYYTKSAMIGLRGKPGYVVGEFECDKITWLTHIGFTGCPFISLVAMKDRCTVDNSFNLSDSCLTIGQLEKYLDGKDGYAWHISRLKIYDKPKPLGEFTGLRATKFGAASVNLTCPPRSWRYVEEEEGGNG